MCAVLDQVAQIGRRENSKESECYTPADTASSELSIGRLELLQS